MAVGHCWNCENEWDVFGVDAPDLCPDCRELGKTISQQFAADETE